MTVKKTLFIISSFLFILFLFSCKENTLYNKSINLPENTWQINDTLNFQTEIVNNKTFYNIFFNVKIQDDYLTDNLWLSVNSQSPSGNILNDTVMFFITDQKGKWFGKKKGHSIKNKFLYKAHILFPETGIYKFKIYHRMRENDLPKVSSFGISIEKTK